MSKSYILGFFYKVNLAKCMSQICDNGPLRSITARSRVFAVMSKCNGQVHTDTFS